MMKVELFKIYRNVAGEFRMILWLTPEEWMPYFFMDHLEWTYDENGVYDWHDEHQGGDPYKLVSEVTPESVGESEYALIKAVLFMEMHIHMKGHSIDPTANRQINRLRERYGIRPFYREHYH